MLVLIFVVFFFQAEDGIRDLVRSRGLGDVYKRQGLMRDRLEILHRLLSEDGWLWITIDDNEAHYLKVCLLYTSDAADERSSVDLGGRRIIKKKKYEERGSSIIVQNKITAWSR